MRHAWLLAVLLAFPGGPPDQPAGGLHVSVTLSDATGAPTPVPRHALLVSDNPATREPRRVLTRVDGTVDLTLPPGSYTIESDRPVTFLGQAYQWTQMVTVVAGLDAALALTADNAEVVPATIAPAAAASPAPGTDPAFLPDAWQRSIVAIWSPTARASGVLVDAGGLIATHRNAVGRATSVEVQVSPDVKVPARVLGSGPPGDVAILRVDPTVVTGRPLPLPCPPATAPSLDEGQEIVAIGTPPGTGVDVAWGTVTGFAPRAIDTDLRLSFGGAGGPVFDGAGAVVGITSASGDGAATRGEVAVVRVGILCEALSAAQADMRDVPAPAPTPLPVDPARPYPADALGLSAQGTGPSAPLVASSTDFDIALLTPPMIARARQRSDRTGGRDGRTPEAEARLGRLTDFGAWSDYFANFPPVLVVRVTPKLVEGFWKRLAREAARTQGAVLPAFTDFKTDFLRMRAACGAADVAPIHPFVLEHAASERDVVREGLYVFDAGAFGPHCGAVTLSLYSGRAPEQADTLTIDPKAIERIWQDFAPYRTAAR